MIALLLLPFAFAVPLQAPFQAPPAHLDTLHIPPPAVEPHIKPEVLKAGFSSKGRGIPVLHDLCSGHDLVRSLNAGEGAVYVYHERRWGFCVSLFAPETPVTVSVTTPLASPHSVPTSNEDSSKGGHESLFEEDKIFDDEMWDKHDDSGMELREGEGAPPTKENGADGAQGLGQDEASWTGRGSMPGSLRLRSNDNCIRILAEVAGVQSDMEVCLGYS